MKPGGVPHCVLLLLVALLSCQPNAQEQQGRELAEQYCAGCHLMPEPTLLDKQTWREGVLPIMGVYLGIFPEVPTPASESFYHDYLDQGLFPEAPLISSQEWEALKQYYESLAPETLVPIARGLKPGLQFAAVSAPIAVDRVLPATTSVFWDEAKSQLWVADNIRKQIYIQKPNGTTVDSLPQTTPVSTIGRGAVSGEMLITQIGTIAPDREAAGTLSRATFDAGEGTYRQETQIENLHRPTEAVEVDLDRDGTPELVISEFGFLTGRLAYWQKNKNDGTYRPYPITTQSGALKTIAHDWNRDGWPDLLVLFGQGDERISVFINQKDGTFQEKVLRRFPPSYGSMDFDLQDFDKDGKPDLLYVCGDNADYSRILKPYHGLYIFRNEGSDTFAQEYFFPVNGAYRAQVADFDQDGNLDIALISFFANYARTPQESFVYFASDGGFDFDAFTTPSGGRGRWITLDTGDVDGDGNIDVILGNCAAADGYDRLYNSLWTDSPPYLILKNNLK